MKLERLSVQELAKEGQWLVGLPSKEQLLFVSKLAHQLTIVGRNSYRPQTDELDRPAQLRAINEIQHRVLACLVQLQTGMAPLGFDASIASLVLEQQDAELSSLMLRAWHEARGTIVTSIRP